MDSENSLLICQYCEKETPSQFNFCSKCYSQIKCIACGTKIYNGSEICLSCGTLLIAKKTGNKSNNIYTRHVKKEGNNYEEDIRFELTDESVGKIAPFIVRQTMSSDKTEGIPLISNLNNKESDEDAEYDDLSKNEEQSQINPNESEVKQSQTFSESPINDFFKKDNGVLIAKENDFKGKSWSEQQRNFIVIFTKAYQDIFQKPVPNKDIIRDAAKKLNLIDVKNFSTYLNKVSSEYFSELSDGFELNIPGIKEATRILNLMTSEGALAGFAYASRPATISSKRLRISSEEKLEVDGWIKDDVNTGKLDVRDVKSGRDAALLALYIITIQLKKAKASYVHTLMDYLNKKFTTISVSSQAVSKALSVSKEAEKYFQKTGDGKYFLSTKGQKLVEDWISGAILLKSKDIN